MGLPDLDHVLHVEDDDADAALIGHLLKGQSYHVSRVRTYGELMAFEGDPPDVVLLDLRIPGSNDPIRLVRDTVRRFRGAGVILLTGIGDEAGEELSVRAMAAGAQSRLLKQTFDKRRLHLAICEAYEQRQHMMRAIEQSRTDMSFDSSAIRDIVDAALKQSPYAAKLDTIDSEVRKAVRKLRRLGAEDTEPRDPVPPQDHRWVGDLVGFLRRHQKLLQWILMGVITAYFALGDYFNGIREAVFETRERVRKLEEKLDHE